MNNSDRIIVYATEESFAAALPPSRGATQDMFNEWWSRRQRLIKHLHGSWRVRKNWRDESVDVDVADSFDSPDSMFVGITGADVATPQLIASLQKFVRDCGSLFSITVSIDDAITNDQLPLFWIAIYSDRIYCFSDDGEALGAFGLIQES
ncbi:hypothetical protein [Rhodopirellula bahusiensis]|uniref:hypothetical protein n=1 Tax=Rhodopirellula bahusiensis TaxID=2014065 RepID=UPI003265FE92